VVVVAAGGTHEDRLPTALVGHDLEPEDLLVKGRGDARIADETARHG